ncbi:TraB/GumN family protein [Thalassotalea maritima]|uniref:TraB/GumN family protein n=1 Tax=Thalassotalea maritima TaxID=3242416 RepID=UPI003528F96C
MTKIWTLSLTLLMLLVSNVSTAKSPVWQVEKNGKTVFIGGTIHLLGQQDYPLPAAFDQAYEKSQVLVLEVDLNKAQTPQFQQQMLAQMTYQDGRTYADVLQSKTVERLNTYMQQRGLPVDNFKVFKPSLLSITLTMVELQRLGIAGTGVDMFYSMRGSNDAKRFQYLELPNEQIEFLADLGKGFEDEYINYTLDDMHRLADMMSEMKVAWRQGDNDALYDLAGKEWQQNFPQSYQSIIVERNNNWLADIESYFSSDEVEFILVGAMHLVGNEGVLQSLRDKGYQITQL